MIGTNIHSEAFPRQLLVINPLAGLGGAERVLIDLIASTLSVEPSLAVHVLTFADGPLLAAVERLGARTSVLKLPPGLYGLGDSGLLRNHRWTATARMAWALLRSTLLLPSFVRALRREVRRVGPDLVQTNGIKAHLLATLAIPPSVPLVWHIHDFLCARPLAGRMLKASAHRANAAIAISDAVAEDTRRAVPALRVVKILNAVDIDEFSPGDGDGAWLDGLAGVAAAPPGTLRVGLVATYARWKGHEVFLNAAAKLRYVSPGMKLRFYIVGGRLYASDGSQTTETELRRAIVELGLSDCACLVPFQTELPQVFRTLDVVVHASTRPEPFGRTILEAMACARPIVFASGGGPEELITNHVSGIAHRSGSAADLARALALLLNDSDLRGRIAAQARRVAVSHFGRARLGPSLLELYRSLQSDT